MPIPSDENMFRRARPATLGAVLAFVLAGVSARGEDSIYEPPLDPVEEQWDESDIDNLIADESGMEPDIDITGDAFVSSIPQTSWSAGAEVVAFHPSYDGVDFSEDGDDLYTAAPRYYLGWESASGYGIRSRYWKQASTVIGTYPYHLAAESFDLDFYKRLEVHRTGLMVGAGLKSNDFDSGNSGSYAYQETVSTVGASLFSDLNHVLYQTERGQLSLVASARMGFLSGEKSTTFAYYDPNHILVSGFTYEGDIDMSVTEGALGLEWQRHLGWSVLVLRGQYETQLWNTDWSDDVAFNGGALRVGLSW